MHGRKKSDLPQTKEEKDAVQAKISNYKKASRTLATNVCPPTPSVQQRRDRATVPRAVNRSGLSLCVSCVLDRRAILGQFVFGV